MEDTKETELLPIDPKVNIEVSNRERWDRKLEFILSCIGFAVGYGNFWRFPFKCLKNGGGAFLIPFVVCLVFAGLPLFFLELSIGQFYQCNPIKAWQKVNPYAGGIGYAMAVLCFLVSIYYNVVLAWCCYYFFHTFVPNLPWVTCDNEWNTPECFLQSNTNYSFTNFTNRPSPSKEFFENNMLMLTSGIEKSGQLNWKLTLCLLFSWIMVYFCIWKGIRTTGKVVYVTAVLPYFMLLVLFIKGLTLPGAIDGLSLYITPVWSKLISGEVWKDAASQVFFSITIGFGVMLTFASYNKKHNNIVRDALVIALTDAFTSIFSGLVVFSVIGYMARIQGKEITDPTVASDGPGLVFIVYPAALATLPQPRVWSIIFFLMLITLGLDSQFGQVELICACLIESYPHSLKHRRALVVLAVCSIMFVAGIICTTGAGMYIVHLMDTYSAGLSLLVIGLCETLAICWLLGAENYKNNIADMLKRDISSKWMIVYKYITPVLVLFILIFSLVKAGPLTYENYTFPGWANAIGWLMTLASILCIPAIAILTFIRRRYQGKSIISQQED